MVLKFGENSYPIKRALISMYMVENNDDNGEKIQPYIQNRIEISLDNIIDANFIMEKIATDFDGSLSIENIDSVYSYSGYNFDSIDTNITELESRADIRFKK